MLWRRQESLSRGKHVGQACDQLVLRCVWGMQSGEPRLVDSWLRASVPAGFLPAAIWPARSIRSGPNQFFNLRFAFPRLLLLRDLMS